MNRELVPEAERAGKLNCGETCPHLGGGGAESDAFAAFVGGAPSKSAVSCMLRLNSQNQFQRISGIGNGRRITHSLKETGLAARRATVKA